MSERKQSIYVNVEIPDEVMDRIRQTVTEEVTRWLASPQFEHASREAVRMGAEEYLRSIFNTWGLREKNNPLSAHLTAEVETQIMKLLQAASAAKVDQ